jgi:hypothetical protein
MTADTPLSDLVELLSAITVAADNHVGVDSYEDLLVDLRDLLRSGRVERVDAVSELRRLCTEWPPGAVEALEFTMHELRWPEIQESLEDHRMGGADFRTRDLAAQVLQAFDDDWPEGDIYQTYRLSES